MAMKKAVMEQPRKTSSFQNPIDQEQLAEEIRKVAYQIYEKKGRMAGNELSNWLEAERIIKRKFRSNPVGMSKK